MSSMRALIIGPKGYGSAQARDALVGYNGAMPMPAATR
jgi:hypothetical protein